MALSFGNRAGNFRALAVFETLRIGVAEERVRALGFLGAEVRCPESGVGDVAHYGRRFGHGSTAPETKE
jgi:hypothetical protein